MSAAFPYKAVKATQRGVLAAAPLTEQNILDFIRRDKRSKIYLRHFRGTLIILVLRKQKDANTRAPNVSWTRRFLEISNTVMHTLPMMAIKGKSPLLLL